MLFFKPILINSLLPQPSARLYSLILLTFKAAAATDSTLEENQYIALFRRGSESILVQSAEVNALGTQFMNGRAILPSVATSLLVLIGTHSAYLLLNPEFLKPRCQALAHSSPQPGY